MGLFDRFKKEPKVKSDPKSCEYARKFKEVVENGPSMVVLDASGSSSGFMGEGSVATFELLQILKNWQRDCQLDSNQFFATMIVGFLSQNIQAGSSNKSKAISHGKKMGCSCPELEKWFISKIEIMYDSGFF